MTTLEYIFTFNVTHKVNSVFFVTSHNILTEAIIIYFVCNHWLLERNLNENIVLALNYQTIHPEYILCDIWRAWLVTILKCCWSDQKVTSGKAKALVLPWVTIWSQLNVCPSHCALKMCHVLMYFWAKCGKCPDSLIFNNPFPNKFLSKLMSLIWNHEDLLREVNTWERDIVPLEGGVPLSP